MGQESRASRHLYLGSTLVLLCWTVVTFVVWLARGPLAAVGGALDKLLTRPPPGTEPALEASR